MNDYPPVLIPAKQFDVWTRLYKRFLLEPGPAVGSNAYVAPVVQPITDSDRLLQIPEVRISTINIVATGGIVMFNVPDGERWMMLFNRMRLSGGTWTHNNISLRQRSGGDLIQINEYTASGGAVIFEPQSPMLIDEDWDIVVNVDSFVGAGNAVMQVYILVEAAF